MRHRDLLLIFSITAHVTAGSAHAASNAPSGPVAELGRGFRAFRAGDYGEATRALRPLAGTKRLKNDDWALYLLAESEFYQGGYRQARGHFEQLARVKTGRLAEMAPWRAADCAWMAGDQDRAFTEYQKLLKRLPGGKVPRADGRAGGEPAGVDPVVARFRVAEVLARRTPEEARRAWRAIHRDAPAHPLADEALRRAAPGPAASAAAPSAPAASVRPEERLKRAEALTRDRHWDQALEELALLPADLPPPLRAERDYQIGMTKFQMRRDYGRAAELLLAVAPQLSGERAAAAAFHGARALSRIDRDDDAIAGYRKVVAQHPNSRWAAEAQYLSGWLDYNRGRFREGLPALEATLEKFGKSAFADDAAWCVAFARYLLGEDGPALAALERYDRLPSRDMTPEDRHARVTYWRARILERSGRKGDARAAYRDLARRMPLAFYGLAARARLKQSGETPAVELPAPRAVDLAAPPARALATVPAVARADELLEAGLDVEASWELARDEKTLIARLGAAKATALLLDRYRRARAFHRAFRLAERTGAGLLDAEPRGPARLVWEAAYPKAYDDLVEKYGPPAGNPDLLLYAIMRKESTYAPGEVSYADARGLLQMIPPTSAKVAATAGLSFHPDELYDPELNIRLGAAYIGSLYRKFGQQIPLTAGAYNAGPKAMGRWCEHHGKRSMDELVELIAFAQTREYVKRVVGIYARYRHLYGPSPYELPLTVNAKPAAGGPDY